MFIYDVFTEEQLETIKSDLNSKLLENNWTFSKKWYGQILGKDQKYLNEHGDIMLQQVSSTVKSIIRKTLNKIDIDCRSYDFNALYQIWDKNSGCGLHRDGIYPFVATFYLNEIWTPNDGGLYVYEEDDIFKLFVPTYNVCNYNIQGKYGQHCVTPITPYARDKRYTIQVFAKAP